MNKGPRRAEFPMMRHFRGFFTFVAWLKVAEYKRSYGKAQALKSGKIGRIRGSKRILGTHNCEV